MPSGLILLYSFTISKVSHSRTESPSLTTTELFSVTSRCLTDCRHLVYSPTLPFSSWNASLIKSRTVCNISSKIRSYITTWEF